MNKKAFSLIATVLCGVATVVVTTASWLYIHQEETPAELLK